MAERSRLALLLAVTAAAAVACGGRTRGEDLWWADKHDSGDAAVTATARAPRTIGPLTRTQAAARLTAELARPVPDAMRAIIYANRLTHAGGALSASQRGQLASLIDDADEVVLTRAFAELDRPTAPSRVVALRLAAIAVHTGNAARARAMLEHARGDAALAAFIARLDQQLAQTRAVDPRVIAVLLPLSGPYKRLGREMRLAVVIAAAARPGASLQFIDTKGDADEAARAVDRAVRVHRAVAILGPVGAQESIAAARRAVALDVPIALLAPSQDGASAADGVFRLWSSPEWEAREAARLARSLGYEKLAVLAPRDDVGKAQAEAFRAAATAARASVHAGSYDPTTTTLEADLKVFLNLDPRTNRRLRRHLARRGWKHGWKSFSPRQAFDLLYIPDNYHRAALVASYLGYFNVEVYNQDVQRANLRRKHGGRAPRLVQLLGSSGWHHPSLIPRGGSAVEGALIVDLFSGSDAEEYAHESGAAFAAAFKARVGRVPGAIAAQTYDAALLVLSARAAAARAKGDLRAELARQLRGARLDGACGPAVVGTDGTIRRRATVLRVDGGDFVPHAH